MKRTLLLMICALMISSVALADDIGIFSDGTASNCTVAAGFTTTVAVVHKYSLGATGSRFKVVFPAGTTFFTFNSVYVTVGTLTSDISLGYGQCLTGSIVLGTIVAILGPGVANVTKADLQPFILYTDCVFAELPASSWSTLYVGTPGVPCYTDAVEPSTWGKVKALYR